MKNLSKKFTLVLLTLATTVIPIGCSTFSHMSGNLTEIVDCSRESSIKSTEGVTKKDLTFKNELKEPVKVYWLTYEGKRRFYFTLAPGKETVQHTYVTHPWVIAKNDDHCISLVPNQKPGDEIVRIISP